MTTTLASLKTALATKLNDPDMQTFSSTKIIDLVNRGLAEVGRIMPEMFQEDITPVADQLSYILRTDEFAGVSVPEIEVARVELWDGSTTPATRRQVVPAAASQPIPDTDAGWSNWGGVLTLPRRVVVALEGYEADWLIRVWGYSPYPELADDGDVAAVSTDAKFALLSYARMEAIEELLNDRNLFTQWQTRSGNTDISPAGLMNELNFARADWRSKSRLLTRLRAEV